MAIIYDWILENIIHTQEAIVAIRLIVAAIIGFLIGIERKHVKGDPAILRMHIFICVGACLVSAVGCLLAESDGGEATRIAAQVVGSIGFLGMGVIFRNGKNISGLTTASSLWVVGCIGVGLGLGAYIISILSAIIILLVLCLVKDKPQNEEEHENKNLE